MPVEYLRHPTTVCPTPRAISGAGGTAGAVPSAHRVTGLSTMPAMAALRKQTTGRSRRLVQARQMQSIAYKVERVFYGASRTGSGVRSVKVTTSSQSGRRHRCVWRRRRSTTPYGTRWADCGVGKTSRAVGSWTGSLGSLHCLCTICWWVLFRCSNALHNRSMCKVCTWCSRYTSDH